MIEVSGLVDENLADQIEGYFCEEDNLNWTIVQKTERDAHKLLGYFDDPDSAQQGWVKLREIFPSIPEAPEVRDFKEEDWQNAYKQYLKPWNFENLHWVPIWEKGNYTVPEGDKVVWLDAGMAFGTGAHETTQLCAMRILEAFKAFGESIGQKRVIDAGCGSGILAISAKLLGFGSVMGFDNDAEAVRISKENEVSNGLEGTVDFRVGGLEEVLPNEKADLVLANILANVLSEYRKLLLESVNQGGWLVLSGILKEEAQKVEELFCQDADVLWGTYQVARREQGEWADICFQR